MIFPKGVGLSSVTFIEIIITLGLMKIIANYSLINEDTSVIRIFLFQINFKKIVFICAKQIRRWC